jgi:hypothetical protein
LLSAAACPPSQLARVHQTLPSNKHLIIARLDCVSRRPGQE